ncbi:MAG: AfsR/SARP family transcriptional regulator [Rudaea sp.]
MSTFNIRLFGKVVVQCDGRVIDGLDAHRVQELFCFLVLHRDQPHARESLAGRLWPDTSTSQSRKNLRQAIWQLQSALEPSGAVPGDRILIVEPEWIQFNMSAGCSLDAADVERAYSAVEGRRGMQLDAGAVAMLQAAVDLYQGELLAGWYQDWCLYERERFQHMYLAMLDKLVGYCEGQREYEAGLNYGNRALRTDRARERTHRRVMRLYYLNGNRTEAIRQYARCVEALREELGVEPSASTTALFERICAGEADGDPGMGTSPSFVTFPLEDVQHRLEELRGLLLQAEAQIQEDIQLVQRALDAQRS